MDDIVSPARCDQELLSHSEDVSQIEFQLRNLEVSLQRQPARSFGGIIKLVRKCLFYSKENPERTQLTSPPHFHKEIIFSANAPGEWRSLNVFILGVNLEANESLHKCRA